MSDIIISVIFMEDIIIWFYSADVVNTYYLQAFLRLSGKVHPVYLKVKVNVV